MKNSCIKQYKFHAKFIVILLMGIIAAGCSSIELKQDSNYLPASVFRDNVKNVLSTYGQEHILERSIYRPQFLHYINSLYHTTGPLNIDDVALAVVTWNSVMTGPSDKIIFQPMHFFRLAALSNNNRSECTSISNCKVTDEDIHFIQNWNRNNVGFIKETSFTDFEDHHSDSTFDTGNTTLDEALTSISKDPVGNKLTTHCQSTGVLFTIKKLMGKHAYYNPSDNSITIDPKILTYEFNLRYLIHEMVHATNNGNENSITEEVLAELIGLEVQNRITGIPMELNPYSVFVQHLLHPEYGKLPIVNNIIQSLYSAGLEL